MWIARSSNFSTKIRLKQDLNRYLSNVIHDAGSKTGIIKLILPKDIKSTLVTNHWEIIQYMDVRPNYQHFCKVGKLKCCFQCETVFGEAIKVKNVVVKHSKKHIYLFPF